METAIQKHVSISITHRPFISDNYRWSKGSRNRSNPIVTVWTAGVQWGGRLTPSHVLTTLTGHNNASLFCYTWLARLSLPAPPSPLSGLGSWLLIALMSDIDLNSRTPITHHGVTVRSTQLLVSDTVHTDTHNATAAQGSQATEAVAKHSSFTRSVDTFHSPQGCVGPSEHVSVLNGLCCLRYNSLTRSRRFN